MKDANDLDTLNLDTLSLDALRDIQLPPAIDWWPPAPGWWIAIAVLLVFISTLTWFNSRRKEISRQHKAMSTFDEISRHYRQTQDSAATLSALSQLMRRYALAVFPEREPAGLTGSAWLQFLNETGGDGKFNDEVGRALTRGPYDPNAQIDVNAVLAASRHWLRHAARAKAAALETVTP